jgi:hypothetical protein
MRQTGPEKPRNRDMPEPVALSWRGRLDDDHAVNLPIVEDDGFKLPNRLAPTEMTGLAPGVVRIFDCAREKAV